MPHMAMQAKLMLEHVLKQAGGIFDVMTGPLGCNGAWRGASWVKLLLLHRQLDNKQT